MKRLPASRVRGSGPPTGLAAMDRPMPWLPAWQAFVRVVEAGSMAGAARLLGCTRAQVSRQVAELEAAFGATLLERSTRRLALTPAGQVFHQHALAALESESCQEAAKTLVEMSVLAASAQHSRRLVVFIIICNSCYAFSAQYSAGSLRSGPNTLILFTGYPTTVAFPVEVYP